MLETKAYRCPDPNCNKIYSDFGFYNKHLQNAHGRVAEASEIPASKSKKPQASRSKSSRLGLADLPAELILQIFHFLPTTSAFLNIILSSRRYHEIYLSQQLPILRSLAHNAFLPLALEVLDMWRPEPTGLSMWARQAFDEQIGKPIKTFNPYPRDLSSDPNFFDLPEMKRLGEDRAKVKAITRVWIELLPKGDDYHSAKKDSPALQRTLEQNMDIVYEYLLLPKCIVTCYALEAKERDLDDENDIDYGSGYRMLFDMTGLRRWGNERRQLIILLCRGILRMKLPFETVSWWGLGDGLGLLGLSESGIFERAGVITKDGHGNFVRREILLTPAEGVDFHYMIEEL